MRKRTIILLSVVILAVVTIGITGGYILFFSGDAALSDDGPHFTVLGVSSQAYFAGEDVIVEARVANDEPEREVASPTIMMVTVTGNPSDPDSFASVTAVPTTIVERVGIKGTRMVTAELNSDQGISIVRRFNLSLAHGQSETLTFNFGQVPVGSYVVTVTARSYNNSTMSKVVSVYGAPTLDDWTVTGDAAFMMTNLQHDSVDLNIRNDGEHVVIFSNSQYGIFANSSDTFGVPLQGLNQTMVEPGQTVTVHATIPAAGSYYLDHFAIKVPGRAALVRIPVKAWVSVTA